MTPFGQAPLFALRVLVEVPAALDLVSGGPVRLVRITGGTVSGGLNGAILPGGTDWQELGAGGAIGIEARYLLELDGGARVELQSRGLRGVGASGFWSSIWLRSADPALAALNQTQYLGLGRKLDECVAIDVFELPAL